MTSSSREASRANSQSADPLAQVERPTPSGANAASFGSDIVAETLRALDIPYIALNPGASYRGLHDSLVNYLGNSAPQMLLCLHEEAAVAIAHGYAKVTGKAMGAAVHSNVGLFHATMAFFNAWCDRMPIVVLGATGPVDAAKRRPWIDWIHTARDQGAIVRNYTKWDDQPASPAAAREALLRANWIANTAPQGPVYINLDAEVQEMKLPEPLPPADYNRFMPPIETGVSPDQLKQAVDLIKGAKKVVMLAGRVTRSEEAWNTRVKFAEAIGARVICDLKIGASFPTDHPLMVGAPGAMVPAGDALEAMRDADVIISLDWVDLAGALKAGTDGAPKGKVIQISVDHRIHNGWSMDYQGLAPVDLYLSAHPDDAVPQILAALGNHKAPALPAKAAAPAQAELPKDKLIVEHIARYLQPALGDRKVTLAHLPLSWNGAWWHFRHPLDFVGSDGGGGVGGGPGISVGVALALKNSDRMAVSICGDGDFSMGVTALWTAAHYRIPLLLVVANNQSFFNDEVHQERVARIRNRPVENKWIGQRIADPDLDLAGLARAQGAKGFGPITTEAELADAFKQAVAAVEAGHVAVVDVRVATGYTPAMTATLMRDHNAKGHR